MPTTTRRTSSGSARPRRWTAGRAALVLACWSAASLGSAQDRVVLRKPGSIGRLTVAGQIVEFNGGGLDLKPADGGPVQHYPPEEVVDIETPRPESHERGLELWREGDLDGAVEQFELALKQETRTWGRREILAELVRCAVRRGDWVTAGTRFLALSKSDPETRHFRVIPLIWAPEPVTAAALTAGRGWLQGTSDAGRLMGASLLYHDRERGRDAQATLRDLAKNGPDAIRALAQWQLRREEAFSGRVVAGELRFWERALQQLSPDLQGGPCFLVGEAFSRLHDHELAAAYWSRLPMQCDHDYRLTSRACLETGRALARVGQLDAARSFYRETIERFGETPSAREARDQLSSLKNKE